MENIDIGGPAMIRAAAKNHPHVYVVVDPADYGKLLEHLKSSPSKEALDENLSASWRGRGRSNTAPRDSVVSEYLWSQIGEGAPAPSSPCR